MSLRSRTVTSKPRSASSWAALMPATPPPWISTFRPFPAVPPPRRPGATTAAWRMPGGAPAASVAVPVPAVHPSRHPSDVEYDQSARPRVERGGLAGLRRPGGRADPRVELLRRGEVPLGLRAAAEDTGEEAEMVVDRRRAPRTALRHQPAVGAQPLVEDGRPRQVAHPGARGGDEGEAVEPDRGGGQPGEAVRGEAVDHLPRLGMAAEVAQHQGERRGRERRRALPRRRPEQGIDDLDEPALVVAHPQSADPEDPDDV